jgi:hypothetical protein
MFSDRRHAPCRRRAKRANYRETIPTVVHAARDETPMVKRDGNALRTELEFAYAIGVRRSGHYRIHARRYDAQASYGRARAPRPHGAGAAHAARTPVS